MQSASNSAFFRTSTNAYGENWVSVNEDPAKSSYVPTYAEIVGKNFFSLSESNFLKILGRKRFGPEDISKTLQAYLLQ
jgi:hypothetical protein